MFDLDHAIRDWRRQMGEAGFENPAVLDELESHLRDEVERQVQSGTDSGQAFESAIQRIGQPAVLKSEFAKAGAGAEVQARIKNLILTLSGIPNYSLATSMNAPSSNLEPRWATYVKAAVFLMPAVGLSILCAVFMVPKLQQICAQAGFPPAHEPSFWKLTYSSIQTLLFFADHGLLIATAIVALLILLEWRSTRWPRYRRATVGAGAFLVNTIVLLSFFMMFLTALVVAPALFQHTK
jgi:hypothetical protein